MLNHLLLDRKLGRGMYLDLEDRILPGPKPGDYLVSIGKRGLNSAYLVLSSYQVKRRDPKAVPRFQMRVDRVELARVPSDAKVFDFHWYPRDKKKLIFEQNLSHEIQRLQ